MVVASGTPARTNSADTYFFMGTQKSKRPPNTAFRQQRLKAWQPILSPQSILPLLILISAIFAPIGIGLIISANSVQDLVVNYSYCETASNEFQTIPSKFVSYHFKSKVEEPPEWKFVANENGDKKCQLKFQIPNKISRPVYVYYKLTNFYQNHRKYVQSFDLNQLKGKAVELADLSPNCNPLSKESGKVIYPCGLIANSLFNDTYSQVLQGLDSTKNYTMSNKNISWKTDRNRYKRTEYKVSDIMPPPNWRTQYPDGYTEENIPDLSTWEEFQIWMRTAGLPRFYKLALKNEEDPLSDGKYIMEIGMNYPVKIFDGTKSFVLTTNSIIGGRNMSLGIAYLVVAGISLLFGFVFLAKLIIQPRKLGDHTYLNFHQQEENPSDVPIVPQLREML
ncbi:aminophospholipid translocase regulatory protein CDC50 Ecym_6037 [Eremothecium cymbalariae DBVPG|uniref:Cell division control protein 50 n=1 Tax=Eremothecium cymbalariae (strain CBS 270.75 / DBVPG 7215 / KCTC 17166 / NRRL Y-17582) TaxID=931890 RepID=G8JUW2_ERECY|nr:hypothetical protein Ecym_6037 [Eremothecium cymbalariae DBVPG\